MKKTTVCTAEHEQVYKRYCDDMLQQDPSIPVPGFGGLISKLEKALSNSADDSVIRKVSNGCAKRKQAKENRRAYSKSLAEKDVGGDVVMGNKSNSTSADTNSNSIDNTSSYE